MINKKGQQEMVGFILIISLVVIASLIFLIITIRKPTQENQSQSVDNMISSIMSYTTECAISFEPQYSTMRDVVKSCYDNENCDNLNKEACEYLNESIRTIMSDVMKSESTISAYQLDIYLRNRDNSTSNAVIIPSIKEGNCTGAAFGAQKAIAVDSGNIIVRLRIC